MADQDFWAERHRAYLRLLGLTQLSPGAQAKIDLSGVIQATMLEAYQNDQIATIAGEQQLPWLRRVFLNNLLDALRQRRAKRRDMRRELQLDDPIERSASRLETYLQAAESSPSAKAIRHEQAELLLRAISGLPEDQRTAIELHHLQELPLKEIATKMNRPKGAVAALIYRGIKKLRDLNPTLAVAGVLLIVLHIACLPIWQRRQRQFYSSTLWSREHGIDPKGLKLFNWRGNRKLK